MKRILILSILLMPFLAFSQEKKIEKEERIDVERLPEDISTFILQNIPEQARKVRFYYETDRNEESYEAKFKFRGKRFSAEFDTNGKLQDIEVEAEDDELAQNILKNIERYIESQHERFRIEKIQAQYLSENENAVQTITRSLNFYQALPDNYELIVATKNKGELKKFEMLFDAKGNFTEKREIIRNSYDYLIF